MARLRFFQDTLIQGIPKKVRPMHPAWAFSLEVVMGIIVGLVAAIVATIIVRGLTRSAPIKHFDGDFVSPSYRAKVARQCRNEFDANRLMTSR